MKVLALDWHTPKKLWKYMAVKSGLNPNWKKELLFISPFQRKLNLKKQMSCPLPLSRDEPTNSLSRMQTEKAGSKPHMQAPEAKLNFPTDTNKSNRGNDEKVFVFNLKNQDHSLL